MQRHAITTGKVPRTRIIRLAYLYEMRSSVVESTERGTTQNQAVSVYNIRKTQHLLSDSAMILAL